MDHKNKERVQKFKEAGESRYIYQNELDKACFQDEMACGDFKDLTRITGPDKVLRDKGFNIVKNLKDDGYQSGLASMVYKHLIKESILLADKPASGGDIKNNKILNKELAEELHKPFIRKFYKGKVHSLF